MSLHVEMKCDGCGESETLHGGRRPASWRRLRVYGAGNASSYFDVCSPLCAAVVVESTYDADDVDELARRRDHPAGGPNLHSVPVQ